MRGRVERCGCRRAIKNKMGRRCRTHQKWNSFSAFFNWKKKGSHHERTKTACGWLSMSKNFVVPHSVSDRFLYIFLAKFIFIFILFFRSDSVARFHGYQHHRQPFKRVTLNPFVQIASRCDLRVTRSSGLHLSASEDIIRNGYFFLYVCQCHKKLHKIFYFKKMPSICDA